MITNDVYLSGLIREYRVVKNQHAAPERKLSFYKKELLKNALPFEIINEAEDTKGTVYVNNMGDIIIAYSIINGKVFEKPAKIYFLDANDKVIEKCKIIPKQ